MPGPRTDAERRDYAVGTLGGVVATLLRLGMSPDAIRALVEDQISQAPSSTEEK